MSERLKSLIINDIIRENVNKECDFWGAVLFLNKLYDYHYLVDEDEKIYVYPTFKGVRIENEVFIWEVDLSYEAIECLR